MSDNDVLLGLVALVLVVFSLVVSLFIPRRDPGFPGRNLRVFVVVAILLVLGMLAAVETLGGEHEEEGGAEAAATEAAATETETGGGGGGGGAAQGDPAAGKAIFAEQNCAQCHTLADAGAEGELGPNLDEDLPGKDAAFVEESIVDPDAEVTEGFPDNLMPEDYGEKLDEKQIADLVTYLLEATKG